MYFALFYDTVPDYLERRKPHRQAHLAYAESACQKGILMLAGAFTGGGALFVFQTDREADVEEFAKSDPYVINGVVTSWRVQEWNVVIGGK